MIQHCKRTYACKYQIFANFVAESFDPDDKYIGISNPVRYVAVLVAISMWWREKSFGCQTFVAIPIPTTESVDRIEQPRLW